MVRDDVEVVGECFARVCVDGEWLVEECECVLVCEVEVLVWCVMVEGVLEDVCCVVMVFATVCVERGLVEADVARAAENDLMIWIECDGMMWECVGDLLMVVLDVYVVVCVDYEIKLVYARARSSSSDDVEAYEARLRAEVE